MTKQLVIFGVAIMTTLLALVAVWQFRMVIIYVFISLALAAAVRPFVSHWVRRGFWARIFWVILYVIGLGTFSLLFFLVGKFILVDIQQLTGILSERSTWPTPVWLQGGMLQQLLPAWSSFSENLLKAFTGDQGQLVLPVLLGFTQGVGSFMSDALVIFFLGAYWSVNQIHFERLWLSLLPSGQRKQARDIWRTIEPDLGAYIRSEVAQSLIAFLFLGIGYWLLGSPFPALLALMGALAWLIPVAGAPLALLPPLILGLLTSGPLGVFTVLYTLIVLVALQIWVEPVLFNRKWDNPILTLVIMLAMADAFGLPGILVAPPVSAVCLILWNLLVSSRITSETAIRILDLQERQAHLSVLIEAMDESPPLLVVSSMDRLAKLLEKAEPLLPAEPQNAPVGAPLKNILPHAD